MKLNKIIKNAIAVIHTPTYAQAIELLKEFDKRGLRWVIKQRYTYQDNWEVHKEETCYYPCIGLYGSITSFERQGYTVIPFEEVEFDDEPKFIVGEPVLYQNGERFEVGIVKSVCKQKNNEEQHYFIFYHTGDTAARTGEHLLHKITNQHAFHFVRLDPEGKERLKKGVKNYDYIGTIN